MMFCVARCKRAGFTLIEIMIVIAIIAILAGIVVPNMAMARFEAGLTACQENCRIGLEAVQMARVRHTWKEVVDMLDDGYYGGIGNHTNVYGYLGDNFVEAGYLERPLKCKVVNDVYCYGFYDVDYEFYRDWQYTQLVKFPGGYDLVACNGYHEFGHSYAPQPLYDASMGACFN